MMPVKLPFDFKDIQRVSITACGTASYAASSQNTGWRSWRGCRSNSMSPPNSATRAPPRKGDLAIFISQVRRDRDTLAALRYASPRHAHAVGRQRPDLDDPRRESETVLQTPARDRGCPRPRRLPAN